MSRAHRAGVAQVIAGCALVAWAGSARAYSAGVFGYSGKPPAHACTDCHSGGAAPPVTLNGPSTLTPGESAVYTLDVVTGASTRSAGFDVAVSDGQLAMIAQNNATFLNNGEISHKLPLARGQTVQVRFQLIAPSSPGALTLFATALSADGDGTTSGDGTASATLQLTVEPAPDLAGLDLAGFDLATVDAITSATSAAEPSPSHPDLGPPHDEPRWACGCRVGARGDEDGAGALVLALALLLMMATRSRRA